MTSLSPRIFRGLTLTFLAYGFQVACSPSASDTGEPTGGSPSSGAGGTQTNSDGGGASGGALPGAGAAPAVGGATPSGGGPGVGGASGGGTPGGGSGGLAAAGGSAGGIGTGGSGPLGPEDPKGFAQVERLDRGVVAVPTPGGGNLVTWRLFGYEPRDLPFVVYRDGQKVTSEPITDSTNFLDRSGGMGSKYSVAAVYGGVEDTPSEPAPVWTSGYREIPTPPPPGGSNADGSYTYTSGDGSAGDLDGDGRYELIVKWDPSNAQDNSKAGRTGNVYIDAYTLDGERLWRIDLGVNIRAGAHYTQFVVYDFDGDGRAEVAMRTAPGTKDGTGKFLSTGPAANDDDSADYRNASGYILTGPEYLTVFEGLTGKELATVPFQVARGNVSDWGDNYGNRVDRFLASVAFVHPSGRPSIIMGRGMYTRTTFSSWYFDGSKLELEWISDNPSDGPYAGKGAHSISIANVDDDPMQEIVNGGATFDHDGKPICAVPFYAHGDALHVTDLIPSRPGLEVFMPYEADKVPAYSMRDAHTCEILWKGPDTPSGGEGPGRGVAADVDPRSPGAEAWVSGSSMMRGDTGANIGQKPRFDNFLVWWDGDLSREILDSNTVRQVDPEGGELTAQGCSSNNGTKSTPTLSADLIGDFREEIVFRCGNTIRIYSTPEPTSHRIYTLMHDPQYRAAISWQNTAYNQPPHPSFHIGEGMAEPPVPDIRLP